MKNLILQRIINQIKSWEADGNQFYDFQHPKNIDDELSTLASEHVIETSTYKQLSKLIINLYDLTYDKKEIYPILIEEFNYWKISNNINTIEHVNNMKLSIKLLKRNNVISENLMLELYKLIEDIHSSLLFLT